MLGTFNPGRTFMVNLDFSNVKSRDPLEEGLYLLTIEKAEEALSSNGNPMIKVTYKVDDHEGYKVFDQYTLIESCMFKVKEFFDALGMDTSADIDMDISELVVQQVTGTIFQDPYQAEMKNKVKKVYKVQ